MIVLSIAAGCMASVDISARAYHTVRPARRALARVSTRGFYVGKRPPYRYLIMLLALWLLSWQSALAFFGQQDEFLKPEEAFQAQIMVQDGDLLVRWQIAEGYYLYRDKLKFDSQTDGVSLGEPDFSPSLTREDEFFGLVEVYYERASIRVPIVGEADSFLLDMTSQGCADKGLCYPPTRETFQVNFDGSPAVAMGLSGLAGNNALSTMSGLTTPAQQLTPSAAAPSLSVTQCDDPAGASSAFSNKSFWTIVLAFFVLGALLSLTPCVFPMIPILSSLITGQGKTITPLKGFTLSLVYVLAMAVTYTLAGILAAKSGENLQVALQSPLALSLFAGLFVLLSLSMFGFYELQLPARLQSRLMDYSNKQRSGNYAGVAIMGFLSALIVGPCVAPPLAASLAYISQTGNVLLGGTALFVMSIGMGLPLLAIGISAGRLLPRAGAWMDAIKAVFGVLMLGLAITMLERLAPTYLPVYVPMLLWGFLLLGTAIYMGALEPLTRGGSGWRTLWKGLGIALLAWGVLVLIGAASGKDNPLQPLKTIERVEFARVTTVAELESELNRARLANKDVLLDFYADWCVYCKTMKRDVFPHPLVREALADKWLIQADVTSNTELLSAFDLLAPPVILLFDRDGNERCDNRLIGNVTVEQLLAALR